MAGRGAKTVCMWQESHYMYDIPWMTTRNLDQKNRMAYLFQDDSVFVNVYRTALILYFAVLLA